MNQHFLFIAGHPALDFLNTEQANSAGERVELLATPEQLGNWYLEAGLGDIDPDESLLTIARELRDAIRSIVVAWTGEKEASEDALSRVNAILSTGASWPKITDSFTVDQQATSDRPHPLLPVARATVSLITDCERNLVRRCAGTGCVLWFLDTTKNKRRRWCRMEVCGNREKVAAHYHRQQSKTETLESTDVTVPVT